MAKKKEIKVLQNVFLNQLELHAVGMKNFNYLRKPAQTKDAKKLKVIMIEIHKMSQLKR